MLRFRKPTILPKLPLKHTRKLLRHIAETVFKALLFKIRKLAGAIRQSVLKPAHALLLEKFSWYARWWQWKYHRHAHLVTSCLAAIAVVVVVIVQLHGAYALSTWTQTDWSGGAGPSTTNQYATGTNISSSGPGSVSMTQTAGWSSSYTSWADRQTVTVTNSSTAQTNYQVRLVVAYSSGMNANFSDIRFTDSSGTPLSYWVETETNSTTATVWVKVSSLNGSGNTTLYMYYGNASATSESNGNNVFLLFDDFSNPTLDNTKWTAVGVGSLYTVGSSQLTVGPGSSNWNQGIYSVNGFSRSNLSLDMDYTWTSNNASYDALMFGWKDSTTGVSYTNLVYGYYNSGTGTCSSNCPVNIYESGSSRSPVAGTWSENTKYLARIQMIAAGGALYQQSTDDGTTWTTSYTSSFSTATGLHPAWTLYSGTHVFGDVRVRQWMTTEPTSSFGSAVTQYPATASLTSNIFDTGLPEDWANLTYADTVPAGTSATVMVRAGNLPDLSDAPAFTACSVINSSSPITSTCAPNKSRYVQYQLNFTSNNSSTPAFSSVSIAYSPSDTTPPTTNASSVAMFKSNGGASVSSNGWVNSDPYFTWTAGADDTTSNTGIKGYCLYLGQDPTGNPITTKGDLGTSPVNTGGACQFAVSGTSVDTSLSGYIGTALTSSTSPYYLNVVAIDGADNVYTGTAAQFQFRYDNTPPTNPSYISAPSQFVSSKQVTLTWSTTGSDASSDADSGVAGLQYRIGPSGTWYGASHSGTQSCSDLLSNSGAYTTLSSPDYTSLAEGNNIVYFRTWDNACNVSPAYVTTVVKINSTAPSSPQNLSATPTTSSANSFAFSWLPPASYTGSVSNMSYCYSVNSLPTSSNCTYTAAGQTYLDTGAYATEPGDNTFYLVAKDEAGNINYATAASTTFTANTPAPGVPLNIDIADISVKATSNWKLALSWEAPSSVGAGVSTYRVFRSTNGVNFTDVASTAGISYVDANLSQQTYYYKVQACDSANNCGAFTNVVSFLPTGKFTSPANLISGPSVTATTRTATITWTTDRVSDSSVEYGLSPGHYFTTEAANTDQVTSHSVGLNSLNAGTTYYYRAHWTDVDGNLGTSVEGAFTTLPAPSVSNVVAGNINLTTATIQFTSSNATSVQLVYGGGVLSDTQTLNTSTSTSTYSIPLNGLSPGTTYTYKLNPYDTSGNVYDNPTAFTFTTPPQPVITQVAFQPVPGALTGTEQISWTTNVPATSQISYGLVNGPRQNELDTTMTTEHTMTISDLDYNTQYSVTAASIDGLGNQAVSDLQVFKSGVDTRPPKVSNVVVQPSIVGTGADSKGQLEVSWKTDKAGTSQVAYGQGSNGDYTTKTALNTALVTNHTVVVSGLSTSEVYHLQVISDDAEGIRGVSGDQTAIIGQASNNALSIVFNALQSIFGF